MLWCCVCVCVYFLFYFDQFVQLFWSYLCVCVVFYLPECIPAPHQETPVIQCQARGASLILLVLASLLLYELSCFCGF